MRLEEQRLEALAQEVVALHSLGTCIDCIAHIYVAAHWPSRFLAGHCRLGWRKR